MTTMPLRPWDAPEITSWRRLPMHAIRHRDGDPGVERLPLDGQWRFELFPTPEQAISAVEVPKSRIVVPGCWTVQSFDDVHGVGDLPHYTNVQMPWPQLPPHPPSANPTGVYERDLEVPASWAGRRVVLHVGAAESVLIVQVDGIDVGVSKDSHLAAEFDLTDVVRPGERATLRLTVIKWSDATFIEDQDQWWHGGITRPVFLYSTPPVHLADVQIEAGLTPEGRAGMLSVHVDVDAAAGAAFDQGWSVQAWLEGLDSPLSGSVPVAGPVDSGSRDATSPLDPRYAMDLVYRKASGVPMDPAEASVADAVRQFRRPLGMGRLLLTATVPAVAAWSPEAPRLYLLSLTLHAPDGTVVEGTQYRIGFRTVHVVGNDLLVNGIRFLFRGINRHDFDPLGGRVVTDDGLREDLLVMKRFGFNALRTSHYPNDPV
ncbi:MAG TPA: glycoside hydrolase family 2 TIM barrel-domain containing protein, partial [Kineosporiaceae bacterium]|nr:glycoside hydrolase family 2 TIM barrel-domain containing protein [Kineosporiaceae bacterium]